MKKIRRDVCAYTSIQGSCQPLSHLEFNLYLFNIPLCLLRHINVSDTWTRLEHAHMGSTTCVVCTPWPQRHGAWCGLPPPYVGTRTPKPCAVNQLRKPWVQCHGLMGHQTTADLHHDAYAQHRGAMPCAPRGISHGHNVMARCYGVGLDSGSK